MSAEPVISIAALKRHNLILPIGEFADRVKDAITSSALYRIEDDHRENVMRAYALGLTDGFAQGVAAAHDEARPDPT